VKGRRDVLVRLHSACLTGEAFGSLRCDCGDQLRGALERLVKEGAGVLVYLAQEGRGIGLVNKVAAYALQDRGADTVAANEILGFPPDMREYRAAAAVLKALGIRSVRLMTNNPGKIEALEALGIDVAERVPLEVPATRANRKYMETKRDRLHHLLRTP
jgi:3,4-dihydroxy 2-butanone 4-phosphate synthase/GTP cyclohydrolase II